MIPQEQPEQMQQIGDAIVDGRRSDQQDPAAHDQSCESPVAVGIWIPESVGLIHDEKCDGRTVGRPDGRYTEGLVCDDWCVVYPKSIQERPPLGHEDSGDDQGERLVTGQRNRERDVRLPQAHFVCEQRPAVACDDRGQSLGGGDLVRREPRWPCVRRQRYAVEQRPRRAADDVARRRLPRPPRPPRPPRRREGDGEGFRNRNELLRKNPRPARDGRRHRVGRRRRRGRPRVRSAGRSARAPPTPLTRWPAPASRARRVR